MPDSSITAGERFANVGPFSQRGGDGPNLWSTLGFRRTHWEPGTSTVEWEATPEYGFVTPTGPVIQGGLVTAILDSGMGGACWTVLTTTRPSSPPTYGSSSSGRPGRACCERSAP